jgi:hypothetical protein
LAVCLIFEAFHFFIPTLERPEMNCHRHGVPDQTKQGLRLTIKCLICA